MLAEIGKLDERQERSERLRREILALRNAITNLETELRIKGDELMKLHGKG
jgi:hypothetical protein